MALGPPSFRVELAPERGLALTSLTGGDGDEWIYFDPARGPARPTAGQAYDDVWRGGFEELFPSDASETINGLVMPDHGELWRAPFEIEVAEPLRVVGRRVCTSVPAVVRKDIVSAPDGRGITIGYHVTNVGPATLPYLFKLHPAMRVEAGDEILLPGGQVQAVEPSFGALTDDRPRPWPVPLDDEGEPLDLSRVRDPASGFREFVYVSDLPTGRCGIRRRRTGWACVLSYSTEVFPYCWLFLTYGGWRDYHTAVLEPCTNWPKRLSEALGKGRCATLPPGASLQTTIELRLEAPDAR